MCKQWIGLTFFVFFLLLLNLIERLESLKRTHKYVVSIEKKLTKWVSLINYVKHNSGEFWLICYQTYNVGSESL